MKILILIGVLVIIGGGIVFGIYVVAKRMSQAHQRMRAAKRDTQNGPTP